MKQKPIKETNFAPPVVTVLGHVDHGKTTLLDAIRKTSVAAKEAGGITQRIGAYTIEAVINKVRRSITFIDTPGHEAFQKMRSRGATVADIAILVVAANDGIMPQTVESIEHIKKAKIPFIVAATKIDLQESNIEKLKQQLTKQGVNLEEYGGETPLVLVSAKLNKGIDKLLENIILLSELSEIHADPNGQFKGIVIEAGLDKAKGPLVSIVVKNGKLKRGDQIVTSDGIETRVRAMFDEMKQDVPEALPGYGVELLGLPKLPSVGTLIFKKNEEAIEVRPAKSLQTPAPTTIQVPPFPRALEIPANATAKAEQLNVVLKAVNSGALEAILASLSKNENVILLASGTGNITESDITFAKSSSAIVIGFQVKPSSSVVKLAQSEKVMVKTYDIIYEMLDEIEDVVDALKTGGLEEKLGEARIIAGFEINREKIAGIKVILGRIAKGDSVKVMRGNTELGRTRIKTLKHQKEDINKAEMGQEAGVAFAIKLDFLPNDSIIAIG